MQMVVKRGLKTSHVLESIYLISVGDCDDSWAKRSTTLYLHRDVEKKKKKSRDLWECGQRESRVSPNPIFGRRPCSSLFTPRSLFVYNFEEASSGPWTPQFDLAVHDTVAAGQSFFHLSRWRALEDSASSVWQFSSIPCTSSLYSTFILSVQSFMA